MAKKTVRSFNDTRDAAMADPQRRARIEEKVQEIERRQFAFALFRTLKTFGVKQSDLADRLGVTPGAVSKLRRSEDLQLSTIARLGKAAGVKVSIRVEKGTEIVELPVEEVEAGRELPVSA